jgi:cytochrome c biogenesis protein CcmG/thiol:disulfide interchange protein DsbE
MGRRLVIALQGGAVVLVAGLLGLLVWKVVKQSSNGAAARALAHGKHPAAPNFKLPRIDRPGTLELASLRGKVVVLNFWNAHCIPCRQESRRLEVAYRRWSSRGVAFVGVDLEDFVGDARAFIRKQGVTYPVVHDLNDTTTGPFGLNGYPYTFFVDRGGRLVGREIIGPVSTRDLEQNIQVALRS